MFGDSKVAVVTGVGRAWAAASLSASHAMAWTSCSRRARRSGWRPWRRRSASWGATHWPSLGAYTASKAALAAVARTLAVEVGAWKIRVNGVFLGGVLGDNILHAAEHQSAAEGITVEQWLQRRAATLPLRAMPTPDQCTGPILFLCSELADAVTGQHISVNAGQWTT